MKKTRFLAMILGAASVALISTRTVHAYAPQDRHEEHRAHEYHFRHEDASKLREHYKDFDHIDTAHRTQHRERYVVGGHLPDDWKRHIRPVPTALIRELPPIPRGCAIGYIDGYCVVYVPGTLEVVDVIDLAG